VPGLDRSMKEFPDHLKIPAPELHGGKLIGMGAFSHVRLASWLRCEVAIKELRINDFKAFNAYSQELEILMRLPHPHVVQLLGYNVSPRRVTIVMERLDTTLYDVICDRKERLYTFAASEALDIMWKISLGMKFLHSRGVTHGGLSPKIILMNVHSQGKFDVKIGGFAFSNDRLQLPADVYAFAFLCYAILTGRLPPRFKMDSNGRPELHLDRVDLGLAELIRKCWDRDPENRPEFSDICNRLAEFRAARDVQELQGTVDSAALRWTTHQDDGESSCSEIAAALKSLPVHLRIDSGDVEWRRKIGTGGHNEVYEVNWLGCAFAVKRFKALSASLKEELEFLVKLQHPHVARLIGLSVDDNGGWIMMERMDTDLRKLIDSRKSFLIYGSPFCEEEVRELCFKLALGLNFLHSRNVVHRDVKAANVLVHDHGGHFDVKITDFGVSHRIGNPNVAVSAGTGFWRAPEVLNARSGRPLTEAQLKKTDVYSFAMTCYEIVTGKAPFQGEDVDAQRVMQGCRPTLPARLSSDLQKLITKCWDNDPAKRPDFSTICKVLVANKPTYKDSNAAVAFSQFFRRTLLPFTKGLRSTEYCSLRWPTVSLKKVLVRGDVSEFDLVEASLRRLNR
jgi:serine/threonine protein kinase